MSGKARLGKLVHPNTRTAHNQHHCALSLQPIQTQLEPSLLTISRINIADRVFTGGRIEQSTRRQSGPSEVTSASRNLPLNPLNGNDRKGVDHREIAVPFPRGSSFECDRANWSSTSGNRLSRASEGSYTRDVWLALCTNLSLRIANTFLKALQILKYTPCRLGTLSSAQDSPDLQLKLPGVIRTVFKTLDLDPTLSRYMLCPKYFQRYDLETCPQRSTSCGEPLWRIKYGLKNAQCGVILHYS